MNDLNVYVKSVLSAIVLICFLIQCYVLISLRRKNEYQPDEIKKYWINIYLSIFTMVINVAIIYPIFMFYAFRGQNLVNLKSNIVPLKIKSIALIIFYQILPAMIFVYIIKFLILKKYLIIEEKTYSNKEF
ncbi:hypothetical protein [Mycoplasmopsis lipofaciens]|uniref:hypothetical protein n=1 Tax=Mycoplasmopsis lipofaciens TaxID=114884 RepID=UPI00048695C6|nr:hypothetical protein [Mycoplasmopsis lipofaciens]